MRYYCEYSEKKRKSLLAPGERKEKANSKSIGYHDNVNSCCNPKNKRKRIFWDDEIMEWFWKSSRIGVFIEGKPYRIKKEDFIHRYKFTLWKLNGIEPR